MARRSRPFRINPGTGGLSGQAARTRAQARGDRNEEIRSFLRGQAQSGLGDGGNKPDTSTPTPGKAWAEVSGLILQLDARDVEGIADGGDDLTLEDASGNSKDFSSAGSDAITWHASDSEINDQPYWNFVDTNVFGNRAYDADLAPDAMTLFVLHRHQQASPDRNRAIIGNRDASAGEGWTMFQASNKNIIFQYGNGTTMVNPGSLPAVPTQTWHVLVVRIDKTGGTVDIWLDRLASTTPDTSDTGITYAPNPGPGDNFQIADTGESDFIHQHMLLAHAVLYNQALSVEDIDSLLQRIESDYGLSLIAA